MKKRVQLGLIAEGNSRASAILRLPTLPEELGPVKSASLRVARRLSNALHGGYAVTRYEELQPARLIVLHIPDSSVPRVVSEISSSELRLKDMAFVLSESWLMLDALQPLCERGATVATLVRGPGIRRDSFIVEGQSLAVRQVRRLLERNGARSLELRPKMKPLYFAAQLLATAAPMPLFLTAQQALRASGISGNPLSGLLDEMAQKMLQDFLKGARMNWGGPLAECTRETAEAYFQDLRHSHPDIARVLEEQLSWACTRIPKRKLPAALSMAGKAPYAI